MDSTAGYIHCNVCFALPSEAKDIQFTQCGHFCCKKHADTSSCPVCNARTIYLPLSQKIPPSVRPYFQSAIEQVEKVKEIQTFQLGHWKSLVAGLSSRLHRLEDERAERGSEIQTLHAQVSQLKAENKRLRTQDAPSRPSSTMRIAAPPSPRVAPFLTPVPFRHGWKRFGGPITPRPSLTQKLSRPLLDRTASPMYSPSIKRARLEPESMPTTPRTPEPNRQEKKVDSAGVYSHGGRSRFARLGDRLGKSEVFTRQSRAHRATMAHSAPNPTMRVNKYREELEKWLNSSENRDVERGRDVLDQLGQIAINVDVLKQTKIGFLVNKLRKDTDEKVRESAHQLLKKWKSVAANSAVSTPTRPKALGLAQSSPKLTSREGESAVSPSLAVPESPKSPGDVRQKVVNLFVGAFELPGPGEDTPLLPIDVATQIENALFTQFKPTDRKYRQKAISLSQSLKKNAELQSRLLQAKLMPRDFIVMSPEELLTDEGRETVKKIRQWHFDASRTDWDETHGTLATTDQFKCGKCGGRETTYTQKQTRSADEPMTTFVYCITCKNRWKFC